MNHDGVVITFIVLWFLGAACGCLWTFHDLGNFIRALSHLDDK